MFEDTLKGPLYERMIGNPISNFADMVMVGKRIEAAIKSGRIDNGENHRKQFKKKDSEVNTTSAYPTRKNLTISQPQSPVGNTQSSNRGGIQGPRKERKN
ncbi:hypothetical protein GQ457_09G013980 [Hibiscus cannabinus]